MGLKVLSSLLLDHKGVVTILITMDAAHDPSIPFSFSHDQQGFRLLALPPELLESVSSEDPPL